MISYHHGKWGGVGKVAKYKIPKYVEFAEELPKTASGKIQKFLLKEWHEKA
jgi:fatty-acyl-CoA synthase